MAKGLWPQDGTPARLEAMSWCTWAYVTYGAVIGRVWLATSDDALRNADHAAAGIRTATALLDLLEARLSEQPWMLGEAYSLVDLVVGQVVGYGTYLGAAVEAHPAVAVWLQQVQARPAMQGEV
ncbi:hypothetical protein D3C71_1514130 [compost metagenome]